MPLFNLLLNDVLRISHPSGFSYVSYLKKMGEIDENYCLYGWLSSLKVLMRRLYVCSILFNVDDLFHLGGCVTI